MLVRLGACGRLVHLLNGFSTIHACPHQTPNLRPTLPSLDAPAQTLTSKHLPIFSLYCRHHPSLAVHNLFSIPIQYSIHHPLTIHIPCLTRTPANYASSPPHSQQTCLNLLVYVRPDGPASSVLPLPTNSANGVQFPLSEATLTELAIKVRLPTHHINSQLILQACQEAIGEATEYQHTAAAQWNQSIIVTLSPPLSLPSLTLSEQNDCLFGL